MAVFSDPGRARTREAAVTLAGTLLAFGCTLALKHGAGLTTSSVLLAVVLSLSVGRQLTDRHSRHRSMLLGFILLPFFAVGATEIGTRMFTHPNLGDTLFVVGMSGAILLRQFGEVGRRAGTLVSTALTATLIAPGPVVAIGPGAPSRWWGAIVALIALTSVRVTRVIAERAGALPVKPVEVRPAPVPTRSATTGRPWYRRVPVSTKLALQMAGALAGAFAAGRSMFGVHWTWTVLTAFIVSSGSRGRGDVTQKAVLRVAGAAGGTLIATALANAFPAHDDWSVVTIFAVLAVALWLRPVSYAFWAAGVTAALALLYGFYGEQGNHLLLDRLEGILIGAGIGVVGAWLVFPIRNVDVIRRQLAIALGAIAARLQGDEPVFPPATVALIRESTHSAELTAKSLSWLRVFPVRWQSPLPYAAASHALAGCARALAALPDHRLALSAEAQHQLTRDVTTARKALAADAARDQVVKLPAVSKRIAAAIGSAKQG
ncbi:MAG TPA: FUSC family protein [Mycobacteriales bacterium]|nr:FUSC family protein [Mycobacteriales bacterium]